MKRRLRAAICRINVMPEGPDAKSVSRGTGFLVAPDLILTALHVVADRRTDPPTPYPGAIQLDFPDQPATAVIHQPYWDCKDDWVLLRCPTPLPIAPLALSTPQESSTDWLTFGFPDANPRDGMVQTGSVENFDGTLDDAPVYQLLSRQAAAGRGAPSRGLSGGPVIVGQQVIGLLRFALMREGETVAGTLYGCPVARAVERCPTLLQLQPPETPSTLDALEIKWRRHRRLLIGAVSLLVLVTLALATKVTRDAWTPALVAALPFEIETDDALPKALTDLHAQIARALEHANVPVMSANAVSHFLDGKHAKFGELAQHDVIGVVQGSAVKKDRQYHFALTFTDPRANMQSKGNAVLVYDIDRLHEVAGAIATRTIEALKIPTSADLLERLNTNSTNRSDAYNAFNHGSAFLERVQMDGPETRLLRYDKERPVEVSSIHPQEWNDNPEAALLDAIGIDPKFAQAWARLAQTYALQLYDRGTKVTVTDAETALAEAVNLNPRLADVHLARGHLLYRRDGDYRGALREYLAALKLAPTNSRLLVTVGLTQRRVGETAAAIENLRTAVKLDPDSWPLLTVLATIMRQERRFVEARALTGRAVSLGGANPAPAIERANLLIADRGDVAAAQALLHETAKKFARPALSPDDMAEEHEMIRRFARNEQSLADFQRRASIPTFVSHLLRSPLLFNFIDRGFREGLAEENRYETFRLSQSGPLFSYCIAGGGLARADAPLGQRFHDDLFRNGNFEPPVDPKSPAADYRYYWEFALAFGALRNREQALDYLTFAAGLAKKKSDAIGLMHVEDARLTVHMHLNDTAKVLDLIATTLKRPSNYSATWLRKDPLFAPLHSNPEFIRLTAQ